MARKRKSPEVQTIETSASSPKRRTRGNKTSSPSPHPQDQPHHGFDPYPVSKVYRLIEPGPVLLVTTGSLADSTHNVMTIGFHTVLQHEAPPLLGIVLGPWDASFAALKKTRECVLAVPSVEMAGAVVDVGNCSAGDDEGEGSSKWERFGVDACPADRVQAPLVGGV